jgi:hypothetical protein
VRLISKSKNRFRCNECGKTAVQLRRKFGSWPSEGFEELTQDRRCVHNGIGSGLAALCASNVVWSERLAA